MTRSYYAHNLAAERLKRCYDIAPPRVQRYLQAEIDFVAAHIRPGDVALDMGCGYGRAIPRIASKAGLVIGVDISFPSLAFGVDYLRSVPNCFLVLMDAGRLAFMDGTFDSILCIQNGISAFQIDPLHLISEGVRAAKTGGLVLFSTYSENFWEHRLEWFQLQSAEGLVGRIDEEKTGNGVIICQDGFRATTFTPGQFLSLTAQLPVDPEIVEVDGSSLFCVIRKRIQESLVIE